MFEGADRHHNTAIPLLKDDHLLDVSAKRRHCSRETLDSLVVKCCVLNGREAPNSTRGIKNRDL